MAQNIKGAESTSLLPLLPTGASVSHADSENNKAVTAPRHTDPEAKLAPTLRPNLDSGLRDASHLDEKCKWKRLPLAVHTTRWHDFTDRQGVHTVVLSIMIKTVGTMIA